MEKNRKRLIRQDAAMIFEALVAKETLDFLNRRITEISQGPELEKAAGERSEFLKKVKGLEEKIKTFEQLNCLTAKEKEKASALGKKMFGMMYRAKEKERPKEMLPYDYYMEIRGARERLDISYFQGVNARNDSERAKAQAAYSEAPVRK